MSDRAFFVDFHYFWAWAAVVLGSVSISRLICSTHIVNGSMVSEIHQSQLDRSIETQQRDRSIQYLGEGELELLLPHGHRPRQHGVLRQDGVLLRQPPCLCTVSI